MTRPQNTSVLRGNDVFLECAATGVPEPRVAWTFGDDGRRIDPSRAQVVPGKGVRLRQVRADQSGRYVCRATNNVGAASAAASVFVMTPPEFSSRPPARTRTPPGGTATLPCWGRGRPEPTILWMNVRDRTFLVAGDATDDIEITKAGDLIVEEASFEDMNVR